MKEKNKVVRIGISSDKRFKNSHGGEACVPCVVSGRYLLFDDTVSKDGYVYCNVMTTNSSEGDNKKLCELVLKVEDVMTALQNMKRE
ncbi:hypothetical protein [Paenibacillus odorifer]|uniref:hypothetical protein n=1 Tax=Paenibacillus odorifer TaxID=189426 RepID=UPI00096FC981|nr:hypothetical protein [Paenibacillus odorifer]OME41441.1 hypothetical protein BSK58_15025 [Paenibacillus odorifer]